MPVFEYDGKKYNVREEHIDNFMKDFPNATSVMERDGQKYRVKSSDYSTFMSKGANNDEHRPTDVATSQGSDNPVQQQEPDQPTPEERQQFSDKMNRMSESLRQTTEAINQRMDNIREYGSHFGNGQSVAGDMRFNAETGKIEREYLTPAGNRYTDKAVADMESYQYRKAAQESSEDAVREQISTLQGRIHEAMSVRGKQLDDETNNPTDNWFVNMLASGQSVGGIAAMPKYARTNNGRLSDPAYCTLSAANNALSDAQAMIREADAAQKDDKLNDWLITKFAKGAARGLGEKLFDVRTWDMGVSDTSDAVYLMLALDKYDKGEKLTENEQMLLDAKALELSVNAYFGSYIGRGYKAGSVTAESIPFMLEMCLNPASSTGQTATAKLTRYALTRYGKNAVRKNAGKYVAAKTATRVAGDILGSMTMAATTGAGHTTADAFNRMNGDILYDTDENGQTVFDGHIDGDNLGTAFSKAFAATTIENYSEMFGNYFSPVLGAVGKDVRKGFDAIGLGRVNQFIDNVAMSDVGRLVHDFEKSAQWNGLIGEYAEEVAGGIMNALVVGDQTLDTDENTGVFNLDQNIDTFLGVSLMGGFLSSVKTVGYRTPKYRAKKALSRAETNASNAFSDPEIWDSIHGALESEENMPTVIESVLTDNDYNESQKRAVLSYIEAKQAYSGILKGETKRRFDGDEIPEQVDAEQSFDNGYSLETPQEMQDARNMLDYQRQRMLDVTGTNEEALKDGSAIDWISEALSARSRGDEERSNTIIDYLNAKATYDGMIQRVRDDIDGRVEQSNARIESSVHRSNGMIQPATMKDDRKVYVISGNLVQYSDGTGIDNSASDSSIIVRDAETGALEQVSPDAILNIDGLQDPTEQKKIAEQQIIQQFAQEAADKIDGVASFNPGDQYTITAGEQGEMSIQITANEAGVVDNGDGTVNATDGNNIFPIPKEVIQQQVDAANLARVAEFERARAEENRMVKETEREAQRPIFALNDTLTILDENGNPVRGSITADADADGKYEVYSENPINGQRINLFSREELDNILSEHNGQPIMRSESSTEESTPAPSAFERIPKDEQGNPLYEQADSDTAWDAIVEQTEGNEDMAQTVANGMVSDKEAALKKAEKAKSKGGATIAEKIASEKERAANIAAAKQELDLWKKIAGVPARRKAEIETERRRQAEEAANARRAEEERLRAEREEAERIEREAIKGVPDFVHDNPKDARARGYRRVNGHKVDRQEPLLPVQGKAVSVKFSNDAISDGRVAIIDASQLQPSHIQGQRNPQHFIDEAQPKERNDQASVVSATKIASAIRPEEITSSVTAYTGAPTVNARGEVIQGNNRGFSLRLMWDNHKEQAEQYRQYLKDNAAEFGLTAEDIDSVQSPVLVNMLNVDDDTAITLGQYVAQDTESGGIERIKPKNTLQKMGADMRSFANMLLQSPDEDTSFAGLVDRNGADVLKWMNTQGFITATQFKSAFDSKGNLTPEAKNDLRGIMYNSIFKGGSTMLEEMFNAMPAKAQKAILSTAFRDYDSPNAERMVAEIQNSIRAYYALSQDASFAKATNYKDARMAVESWKIQYQIDDATGESYLPAENFSNFALHLATMYKGETQSLIQSAFNKLYDLIQGTQEENLFEKPDNTPRSLAQAIKETFNFEYDGQQRSDVLAGNSSAVAGGEQRSEQSSDAGERVESGAGIADDTGSLERGREQGEINTTLGEQLQTAESETDTNPTDAQKAAGNYKKGHIQVGTFNVTIENPKGSVRSGVDANGKKWQTTMNNTYGYIRGTEGVDGDHIDVFLSDDIDGWDGRRVFVVDQYNTDGTFDEHKVMLGFNSEEDATAAYMSNYEPSWADEHKTVCSSVIIDEFEKWIESSHRKTKAFADYKSVKREADAGSLLDAVRTLYSQGKEYASTVFQRSFFDVAQTPKFMQELGLRGDKFTIKYGVISRHLGKDNSHNLTEKDWENLPQALQNPFAITKIADKEDSYRIYTALKTDAGEYVVVGADVKNTGRDIEINAISTVFGRRDNANLSQKEDVIYRSKEITPEQSALLDRPNFGQYPAVQGLSGDKGTTISPNINGTDKKTDGYSVEKRFHKKNNTDIFAVKFTEQMSREDFLELKKRVKDFGGYYSSFGKGGFIFDTEADANRFAQAVLDKSGESLDDAAPLSLNDIAEVQDTSSAQTESTDDIQALETAYADAYRKFITDNTAQSKDDARRLALDLGAAIRKNLRSEKIKFLDAQNAAIQRLKEIRSNVMAEMSSQSSTEESAPLADTKQESAPKNEGAFGLVSDERMEELREQLRKKMLGQLNAGFDPEILSIGLQLTAGHLDRGLKKFADYAKQMIDDFGDVIRPYLKAFYNGARDLPDVVSTGLAEEMTPYDEVSRFDIANFDKSGSDPFATAEMVVAEQEKQEQAATAKQQIINQRNTERRKENEQTTADTLALAEKAESIKNEAETLAETATDEREINRAVEQIDETLDQINNQLALLGFYDADIDDDSKFHESYGYMLTAEKKAVKDATNLAKRLADDLGIKMDKITGSTTSLGRKKGKEGTAVRANIAPAGGDITITLPLLQGRELKMYIGIAPTTAKREENYRRARHGDNLYVDSIMYRIEEPAATGADKYGINRWIVRPEETTYDYMLQLLRGEARKFLPQRPTTGAEQEQAWRDMLAMAERGESPYTVTPEVEAELAAQRNRVEDTDGETVNGYRRGDEVLYDRNGTGKWEKQRIVDFEKDGSPVFDSFGVSFITEIGDWERIKPVDGFSGAAEKEKTATAKKSLKKKITPDATIRNLFNFESETKTNDGNDIRRTDAVRAERLSADGRGHEQRLSERSEIGSESQQQDGGPTDGRGKDSSPEQHRAVRPRLSDAVTNPKNTNNNHSERGVDHAPTAVDARITANIKAIELAQQLIENGDKATPEQMNVLRKFSGWGGLGKAFSDTAYSAKLQELLGKEGYDAATMSANSSYYTPAYVVDTLWDIAQQLGFEGGRILEGSAGIGNILGQMPTSISQRSDIQAVEIDPTSGGILSLLYPDAQVEIQGFEQTRIPNGSIDLAITNVPFVTGLRVNDTTSDKDLSRKFHNIHDFCIAKNVRKLRPGGIGIFITSNGTLDSSKKLRDWVVNEGGSDFIGAFRMNNKTFGGTAVTSDIIVIRKRVNGRRSSQAIDVSIVSGVRTAEFDTGETRKVKGQQVPIVKNLSMDYNKYFIEHPENMAGEMSFAFEHGDTFRPTSKGLYPTRDTDQNRMLSTFVQSFAAEQETAEDTSTENDSNYVADASADGRRLGELYEKDGQLVVAGFGGYYPLEVNSNKVKGHTKVECFKAYAAIKEALADVMEYQTNNEDDAGLKPLLNRLNKAYDGFVKTYGHFNKNTAISFLRNDVDFPNVFSLEKYEETGDKNGNRVQNFGKTDVFSHRVVEKEKEPTPTNVKDGIIASVFKYGRIDTAYIAEQLGESEDAIRRDIIDNGYGFEDPTTRQIELSYQYLSGNVREKLRQAQDNNDNGEYDKNIKALEAVIPMDIPAHLIDFTLGSSWINPKMYDEYVKERTGVDVKFTAVGGTWFMDAPAEWMLNSEKNRSMGVFSTMLHRNILGHTLIEAAMQNKTITVSQTRRRYDGTTETITDKDATQACAVKIDEIRGDFKDWARQKMQSDPELSAIIEREYNNMFNNYVPMSIPDEFVPEYFGGASHKFKMRPHQGRAIVRGTMQPLLLAHEVGTGKTFTLISTAMEMRRLGTARKPMIVVQNATVGQFVASAKELYPNAKILTLEEADRSAEGRKNFYAKIRYNDWDMIVVPQSTFEFIPDSEERQIAYIQSKIEEKMLVLDQMKDADPKDNSAIARQAKQEVEKLRDELAELTEQVSTKRSAAAEKKRAVSLQNAEVQARELLDRRTDDIENFDDMGIDALLVDEAHEYKHLGFATAMQRGVKGVDSSYSKKSQGLYLKAQAVLEKNNGRNVIFATGTPISNTAAEIWTFMRYLMPEDTMKEYGIYYFDDFVRNFGNIQQMLEFTTSGKFKESNRFAGYVNLPELVRIWSGVADTVLTKEAGGVNDKIPDIEGGKAQDIYLPQTRALRSVMKFVKAQLDQFEKMSGKEKKENRHIPLRMYGIAKAAAVDARLVFDEAEDDPNSKTNEAVRQTLRSLKETAKYKGTVAIFADNYQNKPSGFNIYDDIREKLIAGGVPADEVVVIRSGMTIKKKLEIFDKVNSGQIRVVLGSTFTLGTGVNIQERLHTLIHLDAPNRPMDYTQRNGRILRQGNLHKAMGLPVRVLRFGVEDSLDVTAYQRLKTKGAIADSIMNGKQMMINSMTNRVLEEEEDVFGDTVAQLSGSEYAMLKNNAEKNVRKFESRKKQWEAHQTYIHNAKPRLTGQIAQAEKRAESNREFLHAVQSAFPDGKFNEITIGKHTFATVDEAADFIKDHNKSILDATKKMKETAGTDTQTRELTISVGDFTFKVQTELSKEMSRGGGQLFSEVHRKMTYSCPELGLEDIPVHQSLLRNAVDDIVQNIITGKDFSEQIEIAENKAAHDRAELKQLISSEGVPFEYETELSQAREQLREYSELMKKEMAEKEAKYAEMDASVEAANVSSDLNDDDDVLMRDSDTMYRIREDAAPKKTGIGYKVFVLKNGKLYPPMVANPNGDATPFGVWLDADAAPIAGQSKTGRNQVKAGGKGTQGGSGKLAYRPGWHLGEIPYALQFNRNDENGERTLFPANFVWAEVEYAADVDYQDEAMSYGMNPSGKFQHSLAGLPRIPENGAYRYRTNPNPETDPWIITGSMRVNRLLTPSEVDAMVESAGREPQRRQDGAITDEQINKLNAELQQQNMNAGEIIKRVNDRFNNELEQQIAGKLPQGHIYQIGMPGDILRAAGFPMLPIEMSSSRLAEKATQSNHPFPINGVRDLPIAMNNPIAVFNYGTNAKNVIVDLNYRGNQFLVGVHFNQTREGIEISSVRGLFPKENANWLNWISQGKSEWLDKEKIQVLIDQQRTNFADVAYLNLDDVAKIVEKFENPKLPQEDSAIHPAVLRREMAEHVKNLAKKLNLDNVDVVTRISGLQGKKATAKGFYTKSTGKITVVIPNNTNMADAQRTLLHEAVAHYGLRQMFGEQFDTFLDNVFNNADKEVRERIVDMAAKNGWDFRKATEEYLAQLAENTEFEQAKKSSWWQKVKDFFSDMLRKIGFADFEGTLTDNELRYILWRSYENLKEGKHNSVLSEAADVAKQYELNVGEFDPDNDILRRDGDPEMLSRALARDAYERRVKSGIYQSREAIQDSMLGLKEAMLAILDKKTNIEDVDGFENAYLGENRLSSVNKAEADAFAHILFKPMFDEITRLAPTEREREELTDYMMAKHGLERNRVMAERDARKAVDDGSSRSFDELLDAYRKTDYAGLTALTGFEKVDEAEAEAEQMVSDFESSRETGDLWKKVNAVSKAILQKSYECGMMSKQTFDEVSDMYEFYIPLRGFDEKTSAEAYAYLSHKQSAFNAPIKKAQGRKSKADDPFANLQSMAESAIVQGNRNKLVKQKFLNFALNHPSDLVSVSDLWLQYNDVADEWRPVFPDNIDINDTPDEVEQKMQDFEAKMSSLAEADPDTYKRGRDAVNIPYRVVESRDLRQHQVIVKRNGRDYLLTINGNPRVAQALNGQTNPDNDTSGAIGAILRAGEKINRQLSAFYTTRNPDFIVSNFVRDLLYSNAMTWIKESPNYALRYHRNYTTKANPAKMKSLLARYRKGQLDMSDTTDAMFYQFMMNGGETGYANVRDIEQHKNDIRKELKKANGRIKIARAWDLLGEQFDELNRAIENCARFAAFITSREMGRSLDRAIYDAKEISVNFNKKGSGAKFYDANGQTSAGNGSALISGLGRSGFVFWNAAIQGTTNFGRQLKRHPAKAYTGAAALFLLGAIVAYMGGDDDDDNKNAYYNLPEYVRRSNLLFSVGDYWISIPLPIEFRAFYGMGELMTSLFSGKEHLTDSEIASAIAGQATQVLPIDFLEGGGGLNSFVPSAVKPLWEAFVIEKGWTGLPLYKDTPYNKDMPEWTKAYSSANKYIVGIANALNESTGGDKYTKGAIDINPAKIEYMLNGYFGGVFGTIDKLTKTAETIVGAREYDPRSVLLMNRLVKAGDESTEYRAVNKEYLRLKDEHDRIKQRLKHYEEDTDNGVLDYAEKIDFLYNSPEYERYEIFDDYRRDIDELYDELKETVDDEERKDIEAELNEVKKEMISKINMTRKRK